MEEIATQLRELADEIEAEQETEGENDLPEFNGYQMVADLTGPDMLHTVYLDEEGDMWIGGLEETCIGNCTAEFAQNIMEALDAE
jgi:hypothetical protein